MLFRSTYVRDDGELMGGIFQAGAEVTEEAILNSLIFAETTVGRKGRIVEKAPRFTTNK